mmetsp:Transcript_6734/g.19715  ORF Transcript_6734/g.19715 Transcript_6734/m.19715 type:complete len:234 (-) Transcript_6734:156-857(-)
MLGDPRLPLPQERAQGVHLYQAAAQVLAPRRAKDFLPDDAHHDPKDFLLLLVHRKQKERANVVHGLAVPASVFAVLADGNKNAPQSGLAAFGLIPRVVRERPRQIKLDLVLVLRTVAGKQAVLHMGGFLPRDPRRSRRLVPHDPTKRSGNSLPAHALQVPEPQPSGHAPKRSAAAAAAPTATRVCGKLGHHPLEGCRPLLLPLLPIMLLVLVALPPLLLGRLVLPLAQHHRRR